MASTRVVWLLAAVLACTALLVRTPSGAVADAAADAPAPAGGSCNPLLDKTCKPGDPKAPENQEEEGGFGARLPSITKSLPSLPLPGLGKVDRDGDGDTDEDDELPLFDTHMTILGH